MPDPDSGESLTFTVRKAKPADAETLVNLVHELAVYERLEDQAKATADDFRQWLFGPHRAAEAALAEIDGKAVGFAIWYSTFSTFRGRPGLYLEDVFVCPEYRGKGIGRSLLATVARLAVDRGCGRLEWSVLDWNIPSIAFYKSHGARPMDAWTVFRVDENDLLRLADTPEAAHISAADKDRA